MADITLCTTPDCPLAGTCWRKLAPAEPLLQATARFAFRVEAGVVKCAYYIPLERRVYKPAVK